MKEADPEDVEEAIEAIETVNNWVQMAGEPWNTVDLIGVLDERENSPDHLTIVPRVPEGEIPTQWLTASEESFVSMREMR